MSRTSTQQPPQETHADAPAGAAGGHPNYITPAGLARLRERLEHTQRRLASLHQASEDSVMEGEREGLEREWRWLSQRVGGAVEVDLARQPQDRVAFGARVTVDSAEGEHSYRLVGEDEVDAEHGLVSHASPLAQALLGAQVGDMVTWARPSGDLTLEVVAIDYRED
jgi:transcription elongation GreA/GreB family factor